MSQNGPVSYESDTGTYTAYYSRENGETPVQSVIEAVAAATRTDPARMDPIYDAVDPDALNRVFEPVDGTDDPPEEYRVSFRFEGCSVTVYADGRTVVTPPDFGPT